MIDTMSEDFLTLDIVSEQSEILKEVDKNMYCSMYLFSKK